MDIGKEERQIRVEPLTVPIPKRQPDRGASARAPHGAAQGAERDARADAHAGQGAGEAVSAEGNAPAGDKDRGAFVAGIDLDPGSLVGSMVSPPRGRRDRLGGRRGR